MSTAPTGAHPSPKHRRLRPSYTAHRHRRRLRLTLPQHIHSANSEAAYWQHLEERAFGRLAQEADHLFDTSYTWVN